MIDVIMYKRRNKEEFVCTGLSGGLCVVLSMSKGVETVAKYPSTLRDDRVRSRERV